MEEIKEKSERLAKEHADWFKECVSLVYEQAFKHGFKHGYEQGIYIATKEKLKNKNV